MEFLAALIAVMLVQLWGSGAPVHRDGWFLQWSRWCASLPVLGGGSTLLPVVVISVPVFAVLVAYYGIADQWWGLPKLALLVLILLYSLGRSDFRKACESYAQAWRAGDVDAARQLLSEFDCAQREVPDSTPALHAEARARVVYRGFERMFAVLFWFTVAGPALALAYRLAFLYRHRVVGAGANEDNRLAVALADQLLVLFEWLPARALGISFAVVADIRDGTRAWIDLLWRYDNAPVAYLDAMCSTVSGFDDPAAVLADSHDEAAFLTEADDELRQIQVLLNRALVLWLAMMALLQLVL
jgi:AmpE protein